MLKILRLLLSILLLPFIVVVVVPYGLLSASAAAGLHWYEGTLIAWVMRVPGVAACLAGLALFAWCVSLFARVGEGTLAPWDPARKLVAAGPYRFVRNPMIAGVALMLFGETLYWSAWPLGVWACVFVGLNHFYFILSEEPGLEKRFGERYRAYKAAVPRWLPPL
jgi:protein-S-isoprenylcysteine O-methyltransferase Ste14